jgi:uncharacterized protein (DUF58 family)
MLSERGWAASGIAGALLILWVVLGEVEFLAAAALLAAGLAFSVLQTRLGLPEVAVTRHLSPTLVHEGDQAAVDSKVSNRGRRPLVNAEFTDDVGELGSAVFQIGRLAPKTTADAGYRIVCRPRGVYRVGPATVRVTDPLGFAFNEQVLDSADRLIVYPEVEELNGFPVTRGKDPAMQASRPEFSQNGGEDFFTLREYERGDDLRFVHWPSTARKDTLMIKQLETPWQSRALVLFDLRKRAYESSDHFEKAVRGAASVVRHLARSGFDADLWAGGAQTLSVDSYSTVMERLAMVDVETDLDLRTVASRMRQTGRGGALVLVTGIADHELLEVHRLLSRDYRSTIVMAATDTSPTALHALQRAGALTMSVSPNGSWAQAWTSLTSGQWLGTSAG